MIVKLAEAISYFHAQQPQTHIFTMMTLIVQHLPVQEQVLIARLTAVLMPFFNADIVNWDTSSVTDMVNVRGASSLNEDISYGIRPASRHVYGCALTHAGVDYLTTVAMTRTQGRRSARQIWLAWRCAVLLSISLAQVSRHSEAAPASARSRIVSAAGQMFVARLAQCSSRCGV